MIRFRWIDVINQLNIQYGVTIRSNTIDFFIKMIWDEDEKRQAAIGSKGMGLVLESDPFDALIDRVKLAAPEMIELNLNYKGSINLHFITERADHLEVAS